jgi:adenylate kinase
MHKYIIMGVQGSGKGTQAKLLAERLDLEHISVGGIFRWNVQHHTKLGAQVRRSVAAGELVSDDLVASVVDRRLSEHDWNFGFIVDGFPRSQPQARFFLESYDLDAVILLEVPDELVKERILSRRLCSVCGVDYNLIFHRPAVAGICDVCGGQLVARDDDTPQAVEGRLRTTTTRPGRPLGGHQVVTIRRAVAAPAPRLGAAPVAGHRPAPPTAPARPRPPVAAGAASHARLPAPRSRRPRLRPAPGAGCGSVRTGAFCGRRVHGRPGGPIGR